MGVERGLFREGEGEGGLEREVKESQGSKKGTFPFIMKIIEEGLASQ